MYAVKLLLKNLGSSNVECRQDGTRVGNGLRAGYLFNSTIVGIEKTDAILIVGSNPRIESPVLNARIRKRFLRGGVRIALIGEQVDLTYEYEHLGVNPDALSDLLTKTDKFSKVLKKAKKAPQQIFQILEDLRNRSNFWKVLRIV